MANKDNNSKFPWGCCIILLIAEIAWSIINWEETLSFILLVVAIGVILLIGVVFGIFSKGHPYE